MQRKLSINFIHSRKRSYKPYFKTRLEKEAWLQMYVQTKLSTRAYGFFTVSAYLLLYVRIPCVVFPLVYRLSL